MITVWLLLWYVFVVDKSGLLRHIANSDHCLDSSAGVWYHSNRGHILWSWLSSRLGTTRRSLHGDEGKPRSLQLLTSNGRLLRYLDQLHCKRHIPCGAIRGENQSASIYYASLPFKSYTILGMGTDSIPGTFFYIRRNCYDPSVHPSTGKLGLVNHKKEMHVREYIVRSHNVPVCFDVLGGCGDHCLAYAQYLEAPNALETSFVYLSSLWSW